MSTTSKRELVAALKVSYKEAVTVREKTALIDAFVAATGHSRKYAISLLSKEPKAPSPRRREPLYGDDVREDLIKLWCFAGFICGARLVSFIRRCLPVLERQGHISLTDESRRKLLSISASTCDRLLKRERIRMGRSTGITRAGTVLRNQIPVRTFADWNDVTPGFFEADLVGHNGGSVSGKYVHTLTLTDIYSGWTECFALRSKQEGEVLAALKSIRRRLPFNMLGIDTDNGGEFINHTFAEYCIQEKLTFTRSREYNKNDQAHVEQKNGAVVRRLTGPHRYEGERAFKLVYDLHIAARFYTNYFQPSLKLREKVRFAGRVRKRYEVAKTPCERLLESNISEAEKSKLRRTFEKLDLVALLAKIEAIQTELQRLANQPAVITAPEVAPTLQEMKHHRNRKQEKVTPESAPTLQKMKSHRDRKEERRVRLNERRRKPAHEHLKRGRKPILEGKYEQHAHQCLLENPRMTSRQVIAAINSQWPGTLHVDQINTVGRWLKDWKVAFSQQ